MAGAGAQDSEFYVRYYVGHKGKVGCCRATPHCKFQPKTNIPSEIILPARGSLAQWQFGHEFLEFEFRPDGRLRYANNSGYKAKGAGANTDMIRKEVYVSDAVLAEVKRIVTESEIVREDDKNWPEPAEDGRQEFEVVLGNQHISFATAKIGSLLDVQDSTDPEGLRIFYYLVQDLKCLVFSLIGLHFRIKPI